MGANNIKWLSFPPPAPPNGRGVFVQPISKILSRNEQSDLNGLMNKNIVYFARFWLAILLVLTFYSGKISACCSMSCYCQYRVTKHQACDVPVEAMADYGDCCSNQPESAAPCCKFKQDIPKDGHYFLLTTIKAGSPDFFPVGIIAFDDHNLIRQIDSYPRAYFSFTLPRSVPLYLQNLSILC